MKQTLHSTAVSYNLHEHLGEGLNSVVYKAIRSDPFEQLRQTVALKILKSKNLVEIWKNEFASLAKVTCKHCVRVYGFEWVDERPALVLEYVNGITLRQLCLAGPVNAELGHEILAQIQTGLRSLHEHGIFHGDLSLNNVMVDESGLVRLLDFGWANSIEGRVQTTHAFAAPELLSGGRPNATTDLYSLGVIEKMLLQRKSNRLSAIPSVRRPYAMISEEQARQKLGDRVRFVRDHQSRFRQMATRSLFRPTPPRKPQLLSGLMLAIFLLLPQAEGHTGRLATLAHMKVRTLTWTRLQIDGLDLGFAPKDLLLSPLQKHHLKWENGFGEGVAELEIQPGQEKVLRDKDLHP